MSWKKLLNWVAKNHVLEIVVTAGVIIYILAGILGWSDVHNHYIIEYGENGVLNEETVKGTWFGLVDSLLGGAFYGIVIILFYLINRNIRNRTEDVMKLTDDYESLCEQYSNDNLYKWGNVSYPVVDLGRCNVDLSPNELIKKKLSGASTKENAESLVKTYATDEIELTDYPKEKYALPAIISGEFASIMEAHANSTMYNNIVIRIKDMCTEDGKLKISAMRSTYYDSMVTNRAMDYEWAPHVTNRELFEYRSKITPLSESQLSNHIGFNGFIETADGLIIMVKRSANVSVGKRTYGNSIEAAMKAKFALDENGDFNLIGLQKSMVKEIQDEMKISEEHITDLRIVRAYRDLLEGGKPQFLISVKVDQTAEEIQKNFIGESRKRRINKVKEAKGLFKKIKAWFMPDVVVDGTNLIWVDKKDLLENKSNSLAGYTVDFTKLDLPISHRIKYVFQMLNEHFAKEETSVDDEMTRQPEAEPEASGDEDKKTSNDKDSLDKKNTTNKKNTPNKENTTNKKNTPNKENTTDKENTLSVEYKPTRKHKTLNIIPSGISSILMYREYLVTTNYKELVKQYPAEKANMLKSPSEDEIPATVIVQRKLDSSPFDLTLEADVDENGQLKKYEETKLSTANKQKLLDSYKGSTVYDNPTIRVDDIAISKDNKVTISYSKSTYFAALTSNRALDYPILDNGVETTLRRVLEPGPAVSSLKDSKLSNHLGTNGFIEIDGKLIFVKRSKALSVGQSTWGCSVGASIKTRYAFTDDERITNATLSYAIKEEIKDELQISIPDEVDFTKSIFAVYRDLVEGGKPQLLFYYHVPNLDIEKFEKNFKQATEKKGYKKLNDEKQLIDGDEFAYISIDELREAEIGIDYIRLQGGKSMVMVPSAIASVLLLLKATER